MFLGIPYAAPPVGPLRWQPPQPPASWSSALDTTKFGPICAQVTTLGVFAGPANYNEDCLNLNVYTPSTRRSVKLPVLVFIHGGGNFDGESDDYDGTKLSRDGKMVVVTFNYRLGLLGWFAHPALDQEGHPFANYGIMDQQAALRWVRNNIASFGGDSDNVTLAGQSAGSFDTAANLVSPSAKGLFHRAILESLFSDSRPLAAAEQIGTTVAQKAGCDAGTPTQVAACLRSLPVQTLVNIQGTPQNQGYAITNNISDGTIIPADGELSAFKNGRFAHVPIMSGFVRDERNFSIGVFEYWENPRAPITADQYKTWALTTFGASQGNQVLSKYPVEAFPSPQRAWNAAGTGWQLCPHYQLNRILSTQVPLFAYEFSYRHPPSYMPDMPGYEPLAYHTSDLQFLFHLFHGGPDGIPHALNPAERNMSDKMVAAWSRFAYTGNPNGIGNVPWPRYVASSSDSSWYRSFDIPRFDLISDTEVSAQHQCNFWAGLPSF